MKHLSLLCISCVALTALAVQERLWAIEPMQEDAPGWRLELPDLGEVRVALALHDGQEHRDLKVENDGTGADGLELTHRLRHEGSLAVWEVEITNVSEQQRWLEPGITLQAVEGIDEASVWLGGQDHLTLGGIDEPIQDDRARGRLLLATLNYANDGVLIGLHPGDLFSYTVTEALPPNTRPAPRLRHAVRTVLEPGSTTKVNFVLGSYDARFGGYLGAVQAYHDAFSEYFEPHRDAHPGFWEVSAHYWMHRIRMNNTLEKMRRTHAAWDWVYAPFKRTGDEWGHEAYWDYEPMNRPPDPVSDGRMFAEEPFDIGNIDREEFLERRQQYFDEWGPLFGLYWYTPAGAWVEYQLAHEQYADALTEDPDYRYDKSGWVTGYDREVKVLPWYTSYEKVLREDYQRIVETYNISGIAMDVARGGPRYRGPAVRRDLPERAYDDEGPFIDQGVAVARFIDFLHTLPVRHLPHRVLAVVGNPEAGGHTFSVSARMDAGMYEGQPYHRHKDAIPVIRYTLGRKPMTWWKGWTYREIVPDWEFRDREHFVRTMNQLVDYVLFQSYKWAALPTANYQWGVDRLREQLPVLQETIRAGWQAQFPVEYEFDGVLYTARYGKDLATRLFWGNPYDEHRAMQASVHNSYLGDGAFVFANRIHQNQTLRNEISNGRTALQFRGISREPILHRAVAAFEEDDVDASVEAEMTDTFNERTIQMAIDFAEPVETVVRVAEHNDMALAAVELDGQPVDFRATDDGYQLAQLQWEDQHELTLTYESTLLDLNEDHLQGFSFLDDDAHPNFAIVVDAPTDSHAHRLPERVQQFFNLYVQEVLEHGGREIPVIDSADAGNTEGTLVLSLHENGEAEGGRIHMPDRDTISVEGSSFEQLDHALLTLLDNLESRFEYHPGFIGTWGSNANVLRHFGVLGEQLPREEE